VLYDEVVALSREAILEQGIIINVDFIADSSRTITSKSGNESYVYEGFFRVSYINMDEPSDRFTNDIVAHAMDAGDKATGKAITYAAKMSLVKVLFLETGINDEKRITSSENYTDDQLDEFHSLIKEEKGLELHMFVQSIPENNYIALYNSFEKGKISSGKKACNELISQGSKDYMELLQTLNDMAKDGDVAITEEVTGLPDYARKMIGNNVEPETLAFIKQCLENQ